MSLRKTYYRLSPRMRLSLRRLWYLPFDIRHGRERARQMIPPKGLIYTGGGDFHEVGNRFVSYFRDHLKLAPDHHVLDVGSGIGRMAVALTRYLNADGVYHGFDVVMQGVKWCRRHITPRFPNFHFLHVDLANDLYTREGSKSGDFVFPYDDNAFDRTIVISVFTHMLRTEVEHYLREIARTLKPGGKVCVTFFLLDPISSASMQGREFRFDYPEDGCVVMDRRVKSANVAYVTDDVYLMCLDAGLKVVKILPGQWSGRGGETTDFQDIVILEKPV